MMIEHKWKAIQNSLYADYGMESDVTAVLFLIGIQEYGQGLRDYSKNDKMDLISLGTYASLASLGYYQKDGTDSYGWPKYVAIKDNLVDKENEELLKSAIIGYFENSTPEIFDGIS